MSGARVVGALALGVALAGTPASAHSKPAGPAACVVGAPAPGPGSLDPFRPPTEKAVELNAAGKAPYRQGKWEEARAQFRAAEAADPELLAPALNIACSFVRQERFAEATAEVVALVGRAYVPWAREVREAADLGALEVRPEMKEIERAMAASAARWADGLADGVLFVARQRPPLRVPEGAGVFILNPHQEVWAFTPATRRYRQITAEDGHVVALAAGEGGRIAYITAAKLVRGMREDDLALRGVAIHELDLRTMTPGPTATIEGDVRRLEIGGRAPAHGSGNKDPFVYTVVADQASGPRALTPTGRLAPSLDRAPVIPIVTLTARGPIAPRPAPRNSVAGPTCSDALVATVGPGGAPSLALHLRGEPPLVLAPREGAGRWGLPIP